MRLAAAGLTVDLPPGWDVRIKRQEASVAGRLGNALLHAATVPMPTERGDFGSGVVDLLRPDDVFVSLLEYDPEEAAEPLFAAKGLPVPRPSDFSTGSMQRPQGTQSGVQYFFAHQGRAFCCHIVVGSHARRAAGAARAAELLARITVGVRA